MVQPGQVRMGLQEHIQLRREVFGERQQLLKVPFIEIHLEQEGRETLRGLTATQQFI